MSGYPKRDVTMSTMPENRFDMSFLGLHCRLDPASLLLRSCFEKDIRFSRCGDHSSRPWFNGGDFMRNQMLIREPSINVSDESTNPASEMLYQRRPTKIISSAPTTEGQTVPDGPYLSFLHFPSLDQRWLLVQRASFQMRRCYYQAPGNTLSTLVVNYLHFLHVLLATS